MPEHPEVRTAPPCRGRLTRPHRSALRREDWKPVLTVNSIIYGLQYLFLVSCDPASSRAACLAKPRPLPLPQEPNPEDPLNKEAAEVLQNNRRLFEQNVHRSLRGGYVGSVCFERCLK